MKRIKVPIIVFLCISITFAVMAWFDVFDVLVAQFSRDGYIDYVSGFDYKKWLSEEPVCVKDMGSKSTPLHETTLSEVVAFSEIHRELDDEYGLSSVADADSDFSKALQILNWLTAHTYYSGAQFRMLTDNTVDILDYTFDKPFIRAINCRYKAIAYADCLVAVGIKAFPVAMCSSDFSASHFTCMAYLSELDRWCCFDPSFGCWFSDENGNPIDIFEIRALFLRDGEPKVNNYNFNGTQECFDVYLNGFMKYCVSNLSTWEDNSMNARDKKSFSGRKQFDCVIPVNNNAG